MPTGEAVQDRKLFIGGLAPQTDDFILKEYFSKWGEIVDVVVMKDNSTGRSRGFGFVTYAESNMAELAVSQAPHEIDGKTVDTKRAISKDAMDEKSSGPTDKVFVGGINKDITDSQLREYFESFGPVKEATVMTNRETGESRCFAFVIFEDYNTVDKVMQSKPHNLEGCQIDVQKAVAKEEMRKKSGKGFTGSRGSNWRNEQRYPDDRYDYYSRSDSYYDRGYGAWDAGYYQDPYCSYGYYDQGYYGSYGPYGSEYGGGPMRGHYPESTGGSGYQGSRPSSGRGGARSKGNTPYSRP